MLKKLFVTTAVLAATAIASAHQVTIEDIGPMGAGLTSGNNVGLDIHVALGGANWLTTGIVGTTSFGSFRYAADANGPVLTGTRDFDATDEVSMLSRPRAQTAGARFEAGGAVLFAGGYIGPLSSTANLIDVAAFQDPFAPVENVDGYIVRVVVDLGGSGITAGDVYAIAGTTPNNAGDILVATGRAAAGTTIGPEDFNYVFWSLFAVPEPASLALLVLGGLAAFRRR
jgi:hypothetical protein